MQSNQIKEGLRVYWEGSNIDAPDTGSIILQENYSLVFPHAGEDYVWVLWDSVNAVYCIDIASLEVLDETS